MADDVVRKVVGYLRQIEKLAPSSNDTFADAWT